MPRRRELRPRLLAAVVRSNATLAFAAERQVVSQSRRVPIPLCLSGSNGRADCGAWLAELIPTSEVLKGRAREPGQVAVRRLDDLQRPYPKDLGKCIVERSAHIAIVAVCHVTEHRAHLLNLDFGCTSLDRGYEVLSQRRPD